MDLFLLCSARACVVVCCGVDARLRVNLRGEIRTGLHEVVVGSMSVAFDFLIFDFLWSPPVAPPHPRYCCFFCFHVCRATAAGGVLCPAEVSTRFFPREEHRYPSPSPFQGVGPSDVAADPLTGALFAERVRTHIPRAWAVDDDEDYVDVEVRQGRC